jgi:hypothetical protein
MKEVEETFEMSSEVSTFDKEKTEVQTPLQLERSPVISWSFIKAKSQATDKSEIMVRQYTNKLIAYAISEAEKEKPKAPKKAKTSGPAAADESNGNSKGDAVKVSDENSPATANTVNVEECADKKEPLAEKSMEGKKMKDANAGIEAVHEISRQMCQKIVQSLEVNDMLRNKVKLYIEVNDISLLIACASSGYAFKQG